MTKSLPALSLLLLTITLNNTTATPHNPPKPPHNTAQHNLTPTKPTTTPKPKATSPSALLWRSLMNNVLHGTLFYNFVLYYLVLNHQDINSMPCVTYNTLMILECYLFIVMPVLISHAALTVYSTPQPTQQPFWRLVILSEINLAIGGVLTLGIRHIAKDQVAPFTQAILGFLIITPLTYWLLKPNSKARAKPPIKTGKKKISQSPHPQPTKQAKKLATKPPKSPSLSSSELLWRIIIHQVLVHALFIITFVIYHTAGSDLYITHELVNILQDLLTVLRRLLLLYHFVICYGVFTMFTKPQQQFAWYPAIVSAVIWILSLATIGILLGILKVIAPPLVGCIISLCLPFLSIYLTYWLVKPQDTASAKPSAQAPKKRKQPTKAVAKKPIKTKKNSKPPKASTQPQAHMTIKLIA